MKLESAKSLFLEFPLTREKSHRFCEFQGYAMPAFEIVYGRTDLRRNKPAFDSQTENRLKAIMHVTDDICRKTGFDSEAIKPLEHGKGGVVFELDKKTVLRMQLGHAPERFEDPEHFLQSSAYLYDDDLNITFEVLPKVKMDVTSDEMAEVSQIVRREHGITVWDQICNNFGRTDDGHVVIVDPDCYQCPKPAAFKA